MGILCRTAIVPDSPVSIAPFGLFCHLGPVLGQTKQRVQSFRMRGDLGHPQAIASSKSIFLGRIHGHREAFLARAPSHADATDLGLSLLLVPTKNFQKECPSELEHYPNLCQVVEIRARFTCNFRRKRAPILCPKLGQGPGLRPKLRRLIRQIRAAGITALSTS